MGVPAKNADKSTLDNIPERSPVVTSNSNSAESSPGIIVNVPSGELVRGIGEKGEAIYRVDFSPAGNRVLGCGHAGTLTVSNVACATLTLCLFLGSGLVPSPQQSFQPEFQALSASGDYVAALDQVDRALQAQDPPKAGPLFAAGNRYFALLNVAGRLNHRLGNYDAAIQHYELVLSSAREILPRRNLERIVALLGVSDVQREVGRYQEAVNTLVQADQLFQKL